MKIAQLFSTKKTKKTHPAPVFESYPAAWDALTGALSYFPAEAIRDAVVEYLRTQKPSPDVYDFLSLILSHAAQRMTKT